MYYYVVKHKKKLTVYSHKFPNKELAIKWYGVKGVKLESKMNRELILVKR